MASATICGFLQRDLDVYVPRAGDGEVDGQVTGQDDPICTISHFAAAADSLDGAAGLRPAMEGFLGNLIQITEWTAARIFCNPFDVVQACECLASLDLIERIVSHALLKSPGAAALDLCGHHPLGHCQWFLRGAS
ncbi:TPA: hypothetical protein UN269_003492 [Stenotrophomonas maltophilia]|nr:hypothetical protein [Stenotrophomonas maltophilia]